MDVIFISFHVNDMVSTFFFIASPPMFVSVEELMETAKGVTNMALAHEIVVNGTFQMKPPEPAEGT